VFHPDKNFVIPNKFTLLGHRYEVVRLKNLFETEGCYGNADDDLKLIKLQEVGTVTKKYDEDGKQWTVDFVVTEETVMETFFHEVVHIILDATGETTLSENERFVNMMGKSFLEIYLTAEYDKGPSS
jgi:hypothetical protein